MQKTLFKIISALLLMSLALILTMFRLSNPIFKGIAILIIALCLFTVLILCNIVNIKDKKLKPLSILGAISCFLIIILPLLSTFSKDGFLGLGLLGLGALLSSAMCKINLLTMFISKEQRQSTKNILTFLITSDVIINIFSILRCLNISISEYILQLFYTYPFYIEISLKIDTVITYIYPIISTLGLIIISSIVVFKSDKNQ